METELLLDWVIQQVEELVLKLVVFLCLVFPKSIYTSIFGSGTTGPASVGAGAVNTATTTGGQLLEAVNRPIQGPGLSPQMQAIENRMNPKPRQVGIGSSTIGQRLSNLGGRFVGTFPSLSTMGLTAAAFAPVAGLAAANAPETIQELQVIEQKLEERELL
jgi:hypothetical protein